MKVNLKKALCLFLCTVVLTHFLTGCGNGNTAGKDIKTEKETDKKNGKDGGKEREALTISSFNNLITEDFIQAFHQVYPEIVLDIISYGGINGSGYALHSLKHGDIPDIYITSQNFSRESQKQYLLDLSSNDFINNYASTLLDSLEIDGSIYLLPSGYTLTGIYYNKTILKEHGWDVPTSFQELVTLSEEIETAGYKTMGHGMVLDGFPFNYFFNIGNTAYFSTPEGTQWKSDFPKGETNAAGNEELRKTAQYFNQWVKKGFITTEHMDTQEFFNGDCIFFLCLGLSDYTYTKDDGTVYEFGTLPWLSEDGSNNMLTRSVSRYMGINKTLSEKGNEQKLEDALKLLDYISTPKGQQSLMSSSSQYMPSLNESELPPDSPYQEIADLVNQGRTVPLVYVGWEDLVVPVANDIKTLISGECSVENLLKTFDQTRDEILSGSSDDIPATCSETLTMEKTAELIAIAEGMAVNADCAMISLNEYHGNDLRNIQAPGWRLYKGPVNADVINMIRPRATSISTIQMTGAEIKTMQKAGFDLDGNKNPYPYLLFTKNNKELEDNSTYTLAISTGELTEDMLSKAKETEISPAAAIETYLKSLKTVNTNNIDWES